MIRIDHISFEFASPDEKFAYGLYAEWDNFCRNCFEQAVEECCVAYDREKVLYEIGRLELDLGTIPEEDFYREFPRRLKEELQRALPPLQTHTPGNPEKSAVSRRDNLLFFLRYGFPKPEWADGAFDPSEETGWLLAQPATIHALFITRAAQLCLEQEYALRRLLWQTDNREMYFRIYIAALTEPSAGLRDKHRFLVQMMEERPEIPVRFVHEAGNDGELQGMAALLDSPTVRRLIHTEAREHAEVDLPPYWHYLYEWLIRYYPFNGLAVFGGKPEFVRHLHHRLLAFIRKRNGSPYLSKRELTLDFLLEVFGQAYYREVLNAIYGLQPRNADGSPAYDGYFNRELYRVFMELSLLELPAGPMEDTGGKKETGGDHTGYLKMPADTKGLAVLFKGDTRSDAGKRTLLDKVARQQPGLLLEWVREEALKDETLLSLLSDLTDERLLNRLLAVLSFTALERVEKVREYLEKQSEKIAWLKGITESRRQSALYRSIWTWTGNGHYRLSEKESLHELLATVYRETTGNREAPDMEIEKACATIQPETRTRSAFRQTDKKRLAEFLREEGRSIADKRTLLQMTVRQQPEMLLDLIRSEASKDDAFLSLLSELADDRILNRLLAALSFTALETVEKVRGYLKKQSKEIAWLKGITESRWQSAFRKAVLRWMADSNMSRPATLQTLLNVICREVTGSVEGENAVEELAEELDKMGIPSDFIDKDRPETEITNRLQKTLSDTALPEAVRQRAAAAFWEAYRDNYTQATVLLQAGQLLAEVIRLTCNSGKEEIIRRQTMQVFGAERATTLLPLFIRLMAHETELPRVRATEDEPLAARLLYWLATQPQGQTLTTAEIIRSLFAVLWDESELPAVIKRISEITATEEDAYETEALSALLEEAGNNGKTARMSAFQEWNHRKENPSDTVQTLFEKGWNTAEKLADWLENTELTAEYKRELLQTAVTERPREWTALLHNTVPTEKTFDTLTGYLSTAVVLQGMAKVNFYQALVLSRLTEWMERNADAFPFPATTGVTLSSALQKALLHYMQEPDTLERTLTEKEIIEKFLSLLYIIYKGKTDPDFREDTEWKQLVAGAIPVSEQQGSAGQEEQGAAEILSGQELSGVALQDAVQSLVERQPEKLLDWLENNTDSKEILRIAEGTNIPILERWVAYLATVAGFVNAASFLRLMTWLLHFSSGRHSTAALATVLFTWIKETDWKRQTLRQMETYFFSRLYADGPVTDFPLPVESLARTDLPETLRQRLLRHFLRFRPKELLDYIRRSVSERSLPLTRWTEWLDSGDWTSLAMNLSLSAGELLRQVTEVLHLNEQTKRLVWGICLTTENKEEEWTYNSPEEKIRSFVQAAISMQGQEQSETEVESVIRHIEEELHLQKETIPDTDDTPELFPVGNAGLCLLSPWLVRLFGMLGYLDEERKKLKDTASRVRAVFLLQYLVYGEEREYREPELYFNRLLAGLSRHVPLPKRLSLTEEEKQTADSMVAGVKANWPQLKGTSVGGFRQSFIARNGTLEQQEERWQLTVEKKTHDILLESVPWSFRQIRLPWLKKYIQVVWNEKQEFD